MSLADDIAAHDEALAARGLTIWLGAEPTFTRAESHEPWWLFEAEGGEKLERAGALLLDLVSRVSPAAALGRVVGRHFPEEPAPRFALGARWRRDGGACEPLGAAPGAPPEPDPDFAWMTVTPDPGVVEVNLPPAVNLAEFARLTRATYAAAATAGLAAERRRWNGEVTDSGGGGQLTLGGPSFAESPFARHPALLPGLLRYLNRHPSLSFHFAPECLGSASQGPRADEGDPQRFAELKLALAWLDARPAADLPALWAALASLLVDASGNSHRAEVNVEKLANPHIPGRGRLGVVELRALRMQPTPERMIAVAALYRALAGRLAAAPYREPLVDWGAALHDRFALPSFLAADLADVLADLDAHGFGLGPSLAALVTAGDEPWYRGEGLTLTPAREHWPLVGDVASQERRGARVVDASTARLEIVVDGSGPVYAVGREIPLHGLPDGRRIAAVRWRRFVPRPGFHPEVPALDPLVLHHGGRRIALHGWRPDGGAYTTLPTDAAEAARRRAERVVVSAAAAPTAATPATADGFTVDLRLPSA